MNPQVFSDYLKANFPERPNEDNTLQWRYSIRDLTDEFIFFIVVAAGCFAIFYFFSGFWDILAIVGGSIDLGWAIYLLWLILLRRRCTYYQLTPDHFVYSHGLLSQKIEKIQLSDIIQVVRRRSVWEWILRTGTVVIYFKTSTDVSSNPLEIHGIGDFENMFNQIDYYRNYHRLVLYFGI